MDDKNHKIVTDWLQVIQEPMESHYQKMKDKGEPFLANHHVDIKTKFHLYQIVVESLADELDISITLTNEGLKKYVH